MIRLVPVNVSHWYKRMQKHLAPYIGGQESTLSIPAISHQEPPSLPFQVLSLLSSPVMATMQPYSCMLAPKTPSLIRPNISW